jgi:predicted HTH domain antitoxin
MSVKTRTRTQVLDELVDILQPDDLRWLNKQLARLLDEQPQPESSLWHDDDEPLPESATLDQAVQLYLDDKCSLGRAAQLAGVTRWDLQKILYERGTPVEIYGHRTAEEIDELAEELNRLKLLYSGGTS